MSAKISAFIITCDKDPEILSAVIAAAGWADELIVIDKSKGEPPASYLIPKCGVSWFIEPWSPTVESTRAATVVRCSYEWIVCLDDDEILSPACEGTFRDFIAGGHADVLRIPIRHHILGRHDPLAYYWPDSRPTLFRRGAIQFTPTVHAGTCIAANARVEHLPSDHAAYITHLSHADVAQWLEKTNRYTSQPERTGAAPPPAQDVVSWAKEAIGRYGVSDDPDPYRSAVAVLRGVYDVIDGLKRWEATQPDGRAAFAEIARIENERQR